MIFLLWLWNFCWFVITLDAGVLFVHLLFEWKEGEHYDQEDYTWWLWTKKDTLFTWLSIVNGNIFTSCTLLFSMSFWWGLLLVFRVRPQLAYPVEKVWRHASTPISLSDSLDWPVRYFQWWWCSMLLVFSSPCRISFSSQVSTSWRIHAW